MSQTKAFLIAAYMTSLVSTKISHTIKHKKRNEEVNQFLFQR